MRIEKIRSAYDVEIKWVQFPLHPETPLEGRTLETLFNCGADEIAQKNLHMTGLMQAEGLPYGKRTHTYNSRKAQQLAKWAETQDGGNKIHLSLFRAYFVDGKNIAEDDVLADVCQSIGLNTDKALEAAASDEYVKAVDNDWGLSREYGITGVPTYVAGQKGLVGAQPYEGIEDLLVDGGAKKRDV